MAEISKNKPKILIFSLAYAPFIGGAEIAVEEITKRLGPPTGEFEFDLITCNLDGRQKESEKIDQVMVYRVGRGWLGKQFFHYLAYKKAIKLQQKNEYSAIWSIMANRAGLAALKFKEKFPEVKYLLTLQEGDPTAHIYWRTWFWWLRYKKIYQKADHVQVISKWLENRARKFGYQKEISLIPNGVNIASHKKEISDVKRILTVSRLVEKNGLENLIQAFKLLFAKYGFNSEQIVLKIIGDGPLRNKLEKLVQKLNLNNNIFLGHKDYKDLPLHYAQADVFVRPSLSEGFGSAFIEAMAAEVPVIATPVGGIPDFLKEGETGWFCEPKNSKSIAEKIKHVLAEKNKEEVARVVANAKKMVEEKYTWEFVANQMKNIFNNLIL